MSFAAPVSSQRGTYRHWQVRIFYSTWLAYAGYYFCRMNFYAVKKALEDNLGFDTTDLGNLGTAYLLGYMLGQFSSAYFGRKLGPKLLLLGGTGVSIVCNVLFGFSDYFWTILVFMTLNGLAQGTGWPGCIGSLGYWFKRKHRGRVLGVWSTCYQVGPLLASNFAGLMLGMAGFRWAFFGASIVLLVVWGLVLFFHPDTPQNVGLEPVSDEDEPQQKPVSPGQKEGLGWNRQVVISILLMGAVYFCIKFARYLLFSWTAYFLGHNFGLEGDQAAYLSTIFYAAGFGGVLFAGFISDTVFKGRRALISLLMLIGMTLAFLMMATYGAASLIFFTVSMGLAGFMLYGPDSLLSGVGAIDVGSQRGALTAAGIINGMGSAGPIVQEQLVARMYQSSGHDIGPILVLLLAVAGAGTLIMGILWLRARKGKSNL
ncbi:MAG: MFS transporter [Deltaproteobacteria bacterium]|nr:MFS transporter [Deltaproteobacteria bacterium]